MTRPRDSQRKKFWLAFFDTTTDHPDLTDYNACTFAEHVVGTPWWKKRASYANIEVTTRKNARFGMDSSGVGPYYVLQLPHRPKRLFVLAAMCHSLQSAESAWHSPEYCQIMLDATLRFMGKETEADLRAAFKAHKVKTRTWSPEAREAARIRYAKNGLLALHQKYASQ